MNLNLRTLVSESGAFSSISFFPERVVFTSESVRIWRGRGRGTKTKQVPGWRQGLGVGMFKTVSVVLLQVQVEDRCPGLPLQ